MREAIEVLCLTLGTLYLGGKVLVTIAAVVSIGLLCYWLSSKGGQ